MRITIDLPTAVSLALRRFAMEHDRSHEDAAAMALRDWLVGNGYLEQHELDEDTETMGEA